MGPKERGGTKGLGANLELHNGHNEDLSQELQKIVEAIDSIRERLTNSQNGNSQDGELRNAFVSSLNETKTRLLTQLPELVWQNPQIDKIQVIEKPQETFEIPVESLKPQSQTDLRVGEKQLVEKAKQGEEEALSRIYQEFFPRILQHMRAKTDDFHRSEDYAQDVMVKVLENLNSYEWRDLPFGAWVFRITHSYLISQRRKDHLKTEPLSDNFQDPYAQDNMAEQIDEKLNLERVKEVLPQLSDDQRRVIELRFFADLTVSDTAHFMGRGKGTVKVLQHYAIRKLRSLLLAESQEKNLISLFQLSNVLQEPYERVQQGLKELNLSPSQRKNGHSAVPLSIDDVHTLIDYFEKKKNSEQKFYPATGEEVSFTEAARRLGISVGTVVDAIDKQSLPFKVLGGGQRLIEVGFLPQIGAFGERQQALERLIIFSKQQKFKEGQERGKPPTLLDKQLAKKEKPTIPKGSISTAELLKKLAINQVTFSRHRLTRVVTPIKIGHRKFYTPKQQELIQAKLAQIRETRRTFRKKSEKRTSAVSIPEGYVTSQEARKLLSNISRERLRQIKQDYSLTTILVGPKRTYYLKEDILSVETERRQKGHPKDGKTKIPESLVRKTEEAVEELPELKLQDFVNRHSLSVEEVLEAARRYGWQFETDTSQVVLDSWHQRMLMGHFRLEQTEGKARRSGKPRKTPEIPPEGAIPTADLLKQLSISYVIFWGRGLTRVVEAVKIGRQKFYTQEQQEIIRRRLTDVQKPNKKERGAQGETYLKNEMGLEYLDLFRLHLKEIGSVPMNPEDHPALGARIFASQLVLNYLSNLDNLENFPQEKREEIKELLESKTAKTVREAFQRRIAAIMQAAEEGKVTRSVDGEDFQLLAIVDKYNAWMDSKLKGREQDEVIEKQLELMKKGFDSFDRLITSNMRLVVTNAKRYLGHGFEMEDLIGYGYSGLITAAARWDFHKGYQFSTYATHWIRQSISRAIADYGSPIRLPVWLHDKLTKARRLRGKLSQELDHDPNSDEISERLGMESEEFAKISATQNPISLNKPVAPDVDNDFEEVIADKGEDVTEEAEDKALKEAVKGVLDALPPRERKILILRFGIENNQERSLEEISREFHVTRERIRQLESKALRRLRHPSILKKLQAFRETDPKAKRTTVAQEISVRKSRNGQKQVAVYS